jgi:hypothetical protein
MGKFEVQTVAQQAGVAYRGVKVDDAFRATVARACIQEQHALLFSVSTDE